jgi:translation elongation factor EF-Tu-like GTPase
MPFRATVKRGFELAARGTVICVDILEGVVKIGDRVSIPTVDGGATVTEVLAVDFVDVDVGKPTYRAEVALRVRDVQPSDVAVGREVCAAPG